MSDTRFILGNMEDRRLVVVCLGLADGSTAGDIDGAWLISYDPAGCDGCGDAAWSHDPAEAARFTAEEWTALHTAAPVNRPVRPDGKPNRPITMFSLMVIPVEPGQLPSILPAAAYAPPARPEPTPPAEPIDLAAEMRAMGWM
jgi:hypothetical protein